MTFCIISHFGLEKKQVASQRIYWLAKKLKENGNRIYLFTSEANDTDTFDYSFIDSLFTIKNKKSNLFTLLHSFKENHKSKSEDKSSTENKREKNTLQEIIRSNYIFYNRNYDTKRKVFIKISKKEYIKAVSQKMKKETTKKTILITSANPPIMHDIGIALKKIFPDLFWIADYRDPIISNKALKIYTTKKLATINDQTVKISDLITAVSKGFLELVIGKNTTEQIKRKTMVLYNGDEYSKIHNPQKEQITQKISGQITIVYTGSLYTPVQDIEKLVKAIEKFQLEEKIKIIYAGPNSRDLKTIIENNSQIIVDYGYIPKAQAVKLQSEGDILLLLKSTESEKGWFPAKIFEYLSNKKKILVIGDNDKEFNEKMKPIGGIDILPYNDNIMGQYLLEIINQKQIEFIRDYTQIAPFDWDRQIQFLIEKIKKLGDDHE